MKKMEIINKNKASRSVFILCIAFIGLSYFAISMLFRYNDSITFNNWCFYFWESLFDGQLGSYYEYSFQRGVGVDNAWITFLPLILWSFPMWLFKRSSGDVSGMSCVLYSKVLLVVSLVILCAYVYKIIVYFNTNKRRAFLLMLLVGGSLEMLDSIAYAGQDEIIYLMLYVIGLYCLLRGKKIKSIVFFTATTVLCPFMIVIILCQLVIYEKNIIKLFLASMVMIFPLALFEFILRNDALHHSLKQNNTIGIFQKMMNTGTITTSMGPVSIAFTIVVIVAIISYLSNGGIEDKNKKCIIYGSVVFFCMSMLTSTSFYRFCIYIPIFVVAISIYDDAINLKVFLFSIIGLLRFIYSLAMGYNFELRFLSIFSAKIFGNKLLKFAGGEECIVNRFSTIFDSGLYIIRPLIIGSTIFLLYLCINERFSKEIKDFHMPYKWMIVINSSYGMILIGYIILKLLRLN